MAEQRKHATRRAELISATRRVAGRSGLLGTNVRAVAAEASVSAGSVLYYFSTFDELMYATVEGVLEEMYERRRALAENEPDPAKRLVALVMAGIPDEISDHLRMAYESIPCCGNSLSIVPCTAPSLNGRSRSTDRRSRSARRSAPSAPPPTSP